MPMPRLRTIAAALVLALAVAACGGDDQAGAPEDGDIKVRVGINDPQNLTIAVLEFLPESVTVATGTTVEWTVAGPEPHSVTFMAEGEDVPAPGSPEAHELEEPKPSTKPFDGTETVSSGLGPFGPEALEFSMEFGAAGSYDYVCIIHPLMTGTVTVVDDAADAESQTEIDARGADEEAQWLEDGRAAAEEFAQLETRSERNRDGSTTWYVEMGVTTEHSDILTYQPVDAEIKAGDEVVFVNKSGAPHTATFGPEADRPQDITSEEAQRPAPGASPQSLAADTYLNTGWLPPDAPPGQGPPEAARSFRVSVPEAGTYSYVCLLHVPSGMAGTLKAT